jgi:hypothetical protein
VTQGVTEELKVSSLHANLKPMMLQPIIEMPAETQPKAQLGREEQSYAVARAAVAKGICASFMVGCK